jgi:hypothetical protein
MRRTARPEDKVAAWYLSFSAIRDELTPPRVRESAGDIESISGRVVAANDRMAALAASILTGPGGARPIPADTLEDV